MSTSARSKRRRATRGSRRGSTRSSNEDSNEDSRGIAPLVRQASRKLGRALTDDEQRALTARLDTLGPERLGDAVLDLSADELDRWIADPAARWGRPSIADDTPSGASLQ